MISKIHYPLPMNIYKNLDEVAQKKVILPNSIVNGDCLEVMKFIPDKSIDCIIADLPFGITACKWDSVIPFDLLWEQYKRIIKPNGAIVLFGSQPFSSALVMSNPRWFKYEWIWQKNFVAGHLNARKRPMTAHENILIFSERATIYNPQFREYSPETLLRYPIGKRWVRKAERKVDSVYGDHLPLGGYSHPRGAYPTSVQKFHGIPNNNNSRFHPTEKPVAIYEYLAKTYTQENELILDNTAGSGTLAIACLNTNRRYVCIEKDEHYFEVMRDRILNHDPNAPTKPIKKTKKSPKPTLGQLELF